MKLRRSKQERDTIKVSRTIGRDVTLTAGVEVKALWISGVQQVNLRYPAADDGDPTGKAAVYEALAILQAVYKAIEKQQITIKTICGTRSLAAEGVIVMETVWKVDFADLRAYCTGKLKLEDFLPRISVTPRNFIEPEA